MKTSLLIKTLSRVPGVVLLALIASLSLLLSHNAILYFTHGGEYGILPEKVAARSDGMWTACFYVHLPAGIVCLLTPWLSFARNAFPLFKSLHRFAGKIYMLVTLGVICPTGLYLALYAKGGMVTQTGFVLQGILLAWYTYRGVIMAGKGNTYDHINFMIRSYSVAAVVLTFRILHLAFFLLDLPYHDNYAISQWLGISVNLLAAELIIINRTKKAHQLKMQIL